MAAAAMEPVQLWDSIGKGYEEAFAGVPEQQASLQWLLSNLSPRSRVLDVGCGTGKPAAFTISNAGHDVLGIDISSKMLEAARETVPDATFVQCDTRDFKVETSYDAVMLYFSFINGVSQDDIRALFPRLYQWLKPGGLLAFGTVPVEGNNIEITWMGRKCVVSSLSAEETVGLIERAGFKIEHQKVTQFMPKAVEGVCAQDEIWEEPHLFVHARKEQ